MQTKLKQADFTKVKNFIDAETKRAKDFLPIVSEISSTDLWIGNCHIVYNNDIWEVSHLLKHLVFNNKRNAMYYAFLIAYNNTKLIPSLLDIDSKLGNTQNDIMLYKHCLEHSGKDSFKLELYHNKLSEAVAKYKKVRNDMYNWMDYAKYIN